MKRAAKKKRAARQRNAVFASGAVWVLGEDPEATAEMSALGVTREALEDAVSVGEFARDNCTPYHPRSAAGTMAWIDTRATLARSLASLGWWYIDDDGLSLIVHPSGKHAITVQIGDEETGFKRPGRAPRLRHPKGPAMREVVDGNDTQSHLFGAAHDVSAPRTILVPDADCNIWFLLRHRSDHEERGSETRIELALPHSVSESGWITNWLTRIIVGRVELEGPSPAQPLAVDHDSPVDVIVTRKIG